MKVICCSPFGQKWPLQQIPVLGKYKKGTFWHLSAIALDRANSLDRKLFYIQKYLPFEVPIDYIKNVYDVKQAL